MRSLREYIIKADFDFAESFTTESGVQLYASKRFTQDKLSNKVVTIIATPVLADDDVLQPGFEIAIDPTIYFQQNYNTTGDQDNPLVIDRRKGMYRLEPSMILLYRENGQEDWKAYADNLLVEKVSHTEEKVVGSLIVGKTTTEKYILKYTNAALGLEAGNEVLIDKRAVPVPYWFENKEYLWMNNREILAKVG